MSNKIPCGGFKLDNNFLGMNENDELSLTGGSEGEGKAYQYLVTDGTGTAKWEDRLAYVNERTSVEFLPEMFPGIFFVKVSDEIPSWAGLGTNATIYLSDGSQDKENLIYRVAENVFMCGFDVALVLEDNAQAMDTIFPQKGVYFTTAGDSFIKGFSSATSDTPEITWDGSLYTIKKLDAQYLPEPLVLYVHS